MPISKILEGSLGEKIRNNGNKLARWILFDNKSAFLGFLCFIARMSSVESYRGREAN